MLFIVSWSIFQLTTLCGEGEKHLNFAIFAFADGGNQTQATCAANECANHYTIASRQVSCYLNRFQWC